MLPGRGTGRLPVLLLAVCTGLGVTWVACAPAEDRPAAPPERERWVELDLPECAPGTATPAGAAGAAAAVFSLQEDAFAHTEPTPWAVWDVVAADMERDGDADLLMNFHNRGRLELHENDGGRFTLRNPAADDRSGLFENSGIPGLYATVPEMNERIDAAGEAGVFLWHEPDRAGDWHVVIVPDQGGDAPAGSAGATVNLRLRANRPLRLLGLPARHSTRTDEFEVRVEVAERVSFRVDVEFVATGLEVSASAPLRVGPELVRIDGGEVTLWKDDPHGMAWADVRGDPGREIYVTRGALMGTLQPPHAPKVDRFYEYRGGETLYADARDAVPGGYGRGRRVEWVDVDGDLVAELYVGNTDSPNVLLAAGGEARAAVAREARNVEGTASGRGDPAGYRDVAPELGLDFRQGDAFTWLDVDDDGRDDLVFLGDAGFQVAFNRMPAGRAASSREEGAGGGARAGAVPSGGDAQDEAAAFDVRPGREVGIALPPGAVDARSDDLFDNVSIHVLDHDADGRLDLWISGIGPRLGNVLLRNEGGTFSDVTSRVGLAEVGGTTSLIVLDVDNDRYPDALGTGESFRLLRNEAGTGFRVEVVGDGWQLPVARGAAADFDLDCRTDVALVGDRRVLARNTGAGAGRVLRVMPRSVHGDPVGTLVRVVYSDGSVQAQRLGSAGNSQYSQGVAPLRFGIPEGTDVERVEVRWTDGRSETLTAFSEESGGRR